MRSVWFLLVIGAVLMGFPGQSEERAWDLLTADTHLTLSVAGDRPVITHLRDTTARHDWAPSPPSVPLIATVSLDDRTVPTNWAFAKGEADPAAGKLTLTFTNAEPRLVLRSIWRARPGRGPVEHWLEIENLSGRRVTLPHQDSLALQSVAPGAPATVWWIKRGGGNATEQGGTFTQPASPDLTLVLASNCDDGSSPVPWLAIQVGEERGLYVGWEFSGLGRIEAKGASSGAIEINVGNNPDFKSDLEPGETFLVPPAFVGCYAGDIDEGSHSLHRFVVEKLRPSVPQGFPDPTLAYNLYLDAGGNNALEADVLRSARFCRDLGFETFMPDAMWFPATGDWRWDPARFPKGVAPIEEYVHHNAMKLALWCAWTNGGLSEHPDALSVRGAVGKPEWFSGDFAPNWQPGPFYGGQICLACPEAKEWAIRKTQWLVGHHKLDYLKHDCGPIVNHCRKTTHRHRYGVDASYWATMGYYEVQEKLREAFPNVILEDCSGGGHIKDFGVIRRTHYIVTTDTLSNLPDRQSIYDSTFALPPLVLQAYTYDNFYPVKGDNPGPFLWRSAMMGAWQIDPTDTAKWTEDERASAIRAVEIYKQWVRPMLPDAKVHHILPRPDGVHWDGMFYWNARLNRGTLYIFRPDAPENEKTVRLKGIESAKEYWVWCEDGSVAPGVRTGAALMGDGLDIQLPGAYTSDLIYLQDAALGKPDGIEPPDAFNLGAVQTQSDAFSTSAQFAWEPSAHARNYRLIVSETPDFKTTVAEKSTVGPAASVFNLPPAREFHWKVIAAGWGGRQANAGEPGRFKTPPLSELAGVTFVSDMPWASATAGAGNTPHRDTNYYGKTIAIAGKPYPKGVWTHSFNDATPADLVLDIAGKGLAAFAADAGLDDASNAGSVQFQVLVDGAVKAESPVMRPRTAHHFRVDVSGAKQVTLRVLNGNDGFACDHAAWGFARFLAPAAKDDL